jgi:hypothetical protein
MTAVSLTVTGSAANLPVAPAAAASVIVLAPGTPVGANLSPISPPAGVAAPTSSPGGSVAGLLPTIGPGSSQTPVADVSPLGGGTMGSEIAEVGGLTALAVAMLLAITRVSLRRSAPRPAPRHAARHAAGSARPAARHEVTTERTRGRRDRSDLL